MFSIQEPALAKPQAAAPGAGTRGQCRNAGCSAGSRAGEEEGGGPEKDAAAESNTQSGGSPGSPAIRSATSGS